MWTWELSVHVTYVTWHNTDPALKWNKSSVFNLANSIIHVTLSFVELQSKPCTTGQQLVPSDSRQERSIRPARTSVMELNKKKKKSFVAVRNRSDPTNQPAAPISGYVTLRRSGALWYPHPPSVHCLSCRGPGCSERCHTLHRHRLPRFQRRTLRTAGASHKYSSLEHKIQD